MVGRPEHKNRSPVAVYGYQGPFVLLFYKLFPSILCCSREASLFLLKFHRFMLLQTDSFYFVLQSRDSPFANTKSRRKRNGTEGNVVLSDRVSAPHLLNKSSRWYSVIDEVMRKNKRQVNKLKDSRILNMKLHQTLYGFIIFEVDWDNVRGINYSNELQVVYVNVHNCTFRKMLTMFNGMAHTHSFWYCCRLIHR
jgi:hypothetical protein